MLTVADVYQYIDSLAPFETQLDFDNAGLLTGRMTQKVTGIHVALDCTAGVIQEAEKLGASLIVTHHPLMFHARKRITEEDDEGQLLCRLIRGKIALIAAHTNLDQAPGGINNVLADCCGLQRVSGEMFLRVGELDAPLNCEIRLRHGCTPLCVSWGRKIKSSGGWVFPPVRAATAGSTQRRWAQRPSLAEKSSITRPLGALRRAWSRWKPGITPRKLRGFLRWRMLYKPI